MATRPASCLLGPRGRGVGLTGIFRACARDPTEAVTARLTDMLDLFLQYCEDPRAGGHLDRETAVQYFRKAEALYYQVLEAIVTGEGRRQEATNSSRRVLFQGILEHDLIQRSLVACCVEMVMLSHPTASCFPLVLKIFNIAPYHFFKVIEPVLLASPEQGWRPAVVRHLTGVEVGVLESLAWERGSPLWDSVRDVQGPLPTCLQVTPPQYLEGLRSTTPPDLPHQTAGLSVSSAGISDRHASARAGSLGTPDLSAPAGQTQRPDPATRLRQAQPSPVLLTGQMVASATVTTNGGHTVTIPVLLHLNGLYLMGLHGPTEQPASRNTQAPALEPALEPASEPAPEPASEPAPEPGTPEPAAPEPAPATTRPQKVDSLSLFLRKVYQLCSRRLLVVCARLGVSDEMRLRIWTCFEHSLVHHCSALMTDRRLDTLLMCAIFIMVKVSGKEMTFKHIMDAFRTLPHASNSVSRGVLTSGRPAQTSENSPMGANRQSTNGGSSSSFVTPPPTPPSSSAGGVSRACSRQDQQERRALIHFYNSTYETLMRIFSQSYAPRSLARAGAETPPCSPYPVLRTGAPRRLRLSSRHSVYVSPLDTPPSLPSRGPGVLYYINRSSSRFLREINNMIRSVTVDQVPTRRRSRAQLEAGDEGEEEEDGPPVRRPRHGGQSALQRRLQEMSSEQAQAQHQACPLRYAHPLTGPQHQARPLTRPHM